MNTVLSLAEAKQHLNVDFTSDDVLIEQQIAAAIDYASQYIGRPIPWQTESGDDEPVPPSIVAAIKLLVGDLYAHRENTIIGSAVSNTRAAENLLHMYRISLGV